MSNRIAAKWIIFFILIQISFQQFVGVNAWSRIALLFSLTEDHSFRIDPYIDKTIDWAKTPNGHFYSNKPPGPAFMAYPFYAPADFLLTSHLDSRVARDEARFAQVFNLQTLLSVLFQMAPFLFLFAVTLQLLEKEKVSKDALEITSLSMLFGNTAVVFMNSFFGHAVSAWILLGSFLALLYQRYRWFGFLFGWAVLTDYSSIILLFPSLWILTRDSDTRWHLLYYRIVQGALLPLFLWIVYHSQSFGSPFAIAHQFQNPIFVDVSDKSLFGIFHIFPKPKILFELLFGYRRGILWTQPWVFLVLIFGISHCRVNFKRPGDPKSTIQLLLPFSIGSFILLLLVNSAFGGWHGGGSAGPRYLSGVFPLLGLSLGLLYDSLGPGWKKTAWITAILSALFTLVALSISVTPPQELPLWPYYFHRILHDFTPSMALRLAIGLSLLFVILCRLRLKSSQFFRHFFTRAADNC